MGQYSHQILCSNQPHDRVGSPSLQLPGLQSSRKGNVKYRRDQVSFQFIKLELMFDIVNIRKQIPKLLSIYNQ